MVIKAEVMEKVIPVESDGLYQCLPFPAYSSVSYLL